ncbi:MAG: hypothetical protein R3D26_08780 [Cyanobacteriota/Melainabacteria group bacterium]
MSEFDSEAENKRMEEFQDALVELLAGSSSPCVIMETMRIDDRFAEYRDYIEQFDQDMIEVACELVRSWSKWKNAAETPPDGDLLQ